MKVELREGFLNKLDNHVDYIAQDKPVAARKFKNDILKRCNQLPDHPYKHRPLVYFEDKQVRDLIYKGYVVIY